MGVRIASWLAWSLATLSLVLCAATVVLYIPIRSVQTPSDWGTGGVSTVIIFLLPFLAFPIVGALIASRRPRNLIGWICLATGNLWMLNMFSSMYGTYGVVKYPGSAPFPAAIGSLGSWMWVPVVGLFGTYLVLLFPDGRLPSRRWRPVAWPSGVIILLGSAGTALSPGPIADLGGLHNPFALEGHPWIVDAMSTAVSLLPLCILASALSLVLRFRRSGGEEREQIKWIAFAAAVVALGFLTMLVSEVLFAPWFGSDTARPLWAKLLEDAVTLSYAGVPIAVGFAVLRYRLYDIEVLINRTLVYGALTVTLALAYAGSVALLQTVFRSLTGQESQLAVVASTLAIAALFGPFRRRIQELIDRRFYRKKYDAARTLEAFSGRLREETDLGALSADLVTVVRETMQPEHAALWLKPRGENGTVRSPRTESTSPLPPSGSRRWAL